MSSLPLSSPPANPFRTSNPPIPPSTPPDELLFSPSAADAALLINDLADPTCSLASIARGYHTSLEGLTLWMQRPEIANRLNALESACARRSRLAANNYLPMCVEAISSAVRASTDEDARHSEASPRHEVQRRKSHETLLRLTRVLLQIAKFDPFPASKAAQVLNPPPASLSIARIADPTPARRTDIPLGSPAPPTLATPAAATRPHIEPPGVTTPPARTHPVATS